MGTVITTDKGTGIRKDCSIQTGVCSTLSYSGDAYYASDTKPDRVRTRKPTGWMPPKPYSRQIEQRIAAHGRASFSYRTTTDRLVTIEGSYLNLAINPNWSTYKPTISSNMRNRAEIEVLNKLKDQKINLAQAFAERKMTADLVGDTAFKLARAYSQARKGNWKGVAKALGVRPKKSANSWLEYQYGWLPLLGDVHGAAEALAKRELPQDWLVTVKENVTDRFEEYVTQQHGNYGRWEARHKGMRGVFIRLDYVPDNAFLSQVSQLGLTNPMQLAWELVPYSFVVDWLVPVGDWLSAMDAASGFRFLGGSRTERVEVDSVYVPKDKTTLGPNYTVIEQDVTARRRWFDLNRVVYGKSPVPILPYVKNPFSLTHMANGLALLSQVFGRK